jgi:hypothetical protein
MNATNAVSLPRLYALRAMYLLVVVGLGLLILPQLPGSWNASFEAGVVDCMLAAFWALCVLGLRYPLQMIPVLLWELAWKTVWFAAVALPKWLSGHVDPATEANAYACALVVLVPIVMPWGYVMHHYLRGAGAPWSKTAHQAAGIAA